MKSLRSATTIINKGLLIVVVACAALIGMSMVSSRSSQSSSSNRIVSEFIPNAVSLVPTLKIVSVLGSKQAGYQIILKNEHSKGIKAFQIGIESSRITKDFIYEATVISPGNTWMEYCPYQPSLEKNNFVILAVVFEDGTASGTPESVKAIKDIRQGERMQMLRFRPLVEDALQSADSELSIALDKLESQIGFLSVDEEESLANYVAFGLNREKQRLLRSIGDIKNAKMNMVSGQLNHIFLREQLSKLVENSLLKINKLNSVMQ